MVVTYQLCKYSEELRELSALNLLPTNDQDPLGASPTMEAQVAGRVMADLFDDGSIFLTSFVLLNTVQHSGISKHELRLPGVQSCGCCQMTATDKTLDLGGKEHLEWHGCDLPVVQVLRRTSRALSTELAACKRSRPIRGKSDHGGTSCRTSDGRPV